MQILPIIEYKNTHFYVDVRLEEIRGVDDPFNRISFWNIDDLDLEETVFEILGRSFERLISK